MKEKILEAFRELGFKLEEEEGMGYRFHYAGLNLLYMYNENDAEFLNIALPGLAEVQRRKSEVSIVCHPFLNLSHCLTGKEKCGLQVKYHV